MPALPFSILKTASFSNPYGREAAAAIEGNDSVKDLTIEGL